MAFDRAYYDRFYFNARTAVTSKLEARNRARLIAAHADYIGLPVRRILDAGCGTGMLRAPLLKALPRAQYTGMETSEYLCERFGWDHGLIQDYKAKKPFDLVVCYDVLQYLDDRTAARAIASLGRLTRGLLYISALTARDWRENCDRTRTDPDVYLREGEWYGQRLRRWFRPSGVGFWIRRGAPLTAWEMETAAV